MTNSSGLDLNHFCDADIFEPCITEPALEESIGENQSLYHYTKTVFAILGNRVLEEKAPNLATLSKGQRLHLQAEISTTVYQLWMDDVRPAHAVDRILEEVYHV